MNKHTSWPLIIGMGLGILFGILLAFVIFEFGGLDMPMEQRDKLFGENGTFNTLVGILLLIATVVGASFVWWEIKSSSQQHVASLTHTQRITEQESFVQARRNLISADDQQRRIAIDELSELGHSNDQLLRAKATTPLIDLLERTTGNDAWQIQLRITLINAIGRIRMNANSEPALSEQVVFAPIVVEGKLGRLTFDRLDLSNFEFMQGGQFEHCSFFECNLSGTRIDASQADQINLSNCFSLEGHFEAENLSGLVVRACHFDDAYISVTGTEAATFTFSNIENTTVSVDELQMLRCWYRTIEPDVRRSKLPIDLRQLNGSEKSTTSNLGFEQVWETDS